ncbi:MAG TPA: hypothetical protein P5248_04785, partial [Bacteroidales bacterium]|nr:hypothetical protein [Bacteroidales bacterium]
GTPSRRSWTTAATPPGPVTEVLAAWDFSGLSSYGPSPMPPTAQSALVTVVGLTRGAGVLTGGTAASNAWGGTGWNVSDAPTAAAGNKFATFSLSAPAGYLLSLTSVEPYNVRRSSTGPTLGQWQYSLNGTDFLNIGSAITWGGNTTSAGNLQAAIDLSAISGLQQLEGGSTVTMRLLIYGATQETGTWYFNQFQTSHDLIIQGTLLALPDTTTFTGTGDWTEAARWSHGIPGSVTHVIIDGTATLSNNASIRSLEVSASGTLTIADGDTLAVTGDVTHHGGVLSPASGTLRVAGSLRQTIGGSSALVLNDLVLDNPQGLRLGCDLLIPAGLRMTQGKVRTGAFALTLGGSAMVAGCDDAHYVWGTLRHAVNPGDHLKHFCIGDSLRYTPVEVDLGNVSTGGTLSAALVEGPHPQQASSGLDPLRCLPYFWTFNNNGIAFDQYDAVFVYPVDSANSISGSVDLMMERYSGGSWSVLNSGVGTPGELTVTAAAAFSDFQAGEACVQAEVPTLSADLFQLCPGGSTLAYVTNGSLGSATIWSWYADSCGGSALFTGDTVTLDPTLTTTYYVRGEGGCGSPGLCDTLRIELVTPPSGPSLLVKSPDLAQICRGQTASATFTSGSGGAGCADEYRYSLNNGGSWFVYTPGAGIGTGSATTVLVQGRRESCDAGSGCAGTAWQTLASWVTVAAPTGPVLASRFPNLGTVCEGAEVTATINPGSGGVGCSDSLRYSLDNGAGWASYSSGDTLPTAGASVVIIQGRRADCTPGAGCTGTSWTSLAQWTVIAQPSGPVLSARMPDLDTLCQGTDVSATFAAGSGGVGCADQYRVSSDSGVTWSPYTAPALINTAAASTVILQGRRSGCTPGAGCSGTAYADLAVWHFVPQPTGPTLASKDPDLVVASEGTTVSATFNPGSGGIGCADTFRYSIDNGLNWSVYAPASLINTSGASLVIIQGARMGCSAGTDCSGTPFVNLASWLVNAPPLAPELDSRLPDQDEVCEGIPLSATFLEGSGGVDCEDFYRYSIDSGDTWLPYVPGSPIMASGPAHVLVQTQRSDCLSGIPTPWTTRAAWKVNPYSTVTFQLPMHAVCKNATGFKLSGGLPAGGTYSGPAVSANTFFPALSAPGPQTITYTYRNIHQCVSAAQDILQVNPLPVVTLSVTYLCEDAGLAALSKGTPAGGTYSGAHVQGGAAH